MPNIIVVLHPTQEGIPFGPICNAIFESRLPLACPPCRHPLIVGGINEGKVFKRVIVWCNGLSGTQTLEHCKKKKQLKKMYIIK
jgi:hypothetical protein